MRFLFLLGMTAVLLAAGCAPDYRIATAPEPATFAEFAVDAQFGDQIRVDLVDGTRVDAMVVRVEPDRLQLDPQDEDISGYLILDPDQVETIRYRSGPPTVLICGAAVGVGVIVFTGFVESSTLDHH